MAHELVGADHVHMFWWTTISEGIVPSVDVTFGTLTSFNAAAGSVANSCPRTGTTLLLGASRDSLDEEMPSTGIVEFVFGSDGIQLLPPVISSGTVLHFKPKILEWIMSKGNTLDPEDANGYIEELINIRTMLCQKQAATEKHTVLDAEVKNQITKIAKAKDFMMAKWKAARATPETLSDEKANQLDEWEQTKLKAAKKPLVDQLAVITEIEEKLNDAIMMFIRNVKGDDDIDPECRDLMKELEAQFGDVPHQPDVDDQPKEINAATVALERIAECHDGPEKRALFSVLEAAATTPSAPEECSGTKLHKVTLIYVKLSLIKLIKNYNHTIYSQPSPPPVVGRMMGLQSSPEISLQR